MILKATFLRIILLPPKVIDNLDKINVILMN
jgi:hypothetical protein